LYRGLDSIRDKAAVVMEEFISLRQPVPSAL
jgi:hypothetical protein